MDSQQPDWVKYWKDLAPRLENYIQERQNLEVEKYLTGAFSYFSYCMDSDVHKRVTKHDEVVRSAFPMMIQFQDMLRGNIHNNQYLLLAPAIFNLRSAFEMKVNLQYIYQHQDPKAMLTRLEDFILYEEIIGRKNAVGLKSPTEQEERIFASKHPYWAKGDVLKDTAKWNGEGKTMKDICNQLGLMDEYYQIFSLSSKFIHGSPVIRNMYKEQNGLNPIPDLKKVSRFTLLGTNIMVNALEDFMKFFGIPYREVDIAFLNDFFNKASKTI